jgi:hypothetical protein
VIFLQLTDGLAVSESRAYCVRLAPSRHAEGEDFWRFSVEWLGEFLDGGIRETYGAARDAGFRACRDHASRVVS